MTTDSVSTDAVNGHAEDVDATNGTTTNGCHSTGTVSNGTSNPPARTRSPLLPGVYCPVLTFFTPDDELDLAAIGAHAVRLAQAGLVGIVTMGSNGEAVHLTRAEKAAVTRAVRVALDGAGFAHLPIIVGASEQSVTLTLDLIRESAAAGGEYALLVPPSYYRAAMDETALHAYFTAVASASPLPLILYNYPGAVAGIDMDSDLLIRLGRHPNIVGCKFTCGNTGKLARVARAMDARHPSPLLHLDRKAPSTSIPAVPDAPPTNPTDPSTDPSHSIPYMAFGGMADFTLPTFLAGGSGIIAGGANVFPKTCARLWRACEALPTAADPGAALAEAARLQRVLAAGDWALTRGAVPGTKAALEWYCGYGGVARAPLRRLGEGEMARIREETAELWAVEAAL